MCCLQVFAHTLGGAHGAQCIGILRWYEGCWRHMLFAWWVCGGHVQANCLSCGICGWNLVESLSQLAGSTPSYWDLCTQLLWAFPFLPAFSNSQVIQPSSSPYIFGMKLVWQHPIRLQKPGAHFALTFPPRRNCGPREHPLSWALPSQLDSWAPTQVFLSVSVCQIDVFIGKWGLETFIPLSFWCHPIKVLFKSVPKLLK